jgi:hypothetical protein
VNLHVCAILPVRRINNLWSFNVAFGSIPAAPTSFLTKTAR